MSSKILTEDTVPAYLEERSSDIGVFPPNAKLIAKAILGGNVNYAFRVEEESTSRTVFVKQAPEFVAVFGPDGFPLTSERMQKEVDVYNKWRDILGEKLSAKYLPKIYLFDKSRMVFVMEFFDGYTLLDHDLVEKGDVNSSIPSGLGDFMGKTHAATHKSIVSDDQAKYLTSHFENRPMRDIQLEWVFTKAYKETTEEQRLGLDMDEDFMAEIEALKSSYDGKTESLSLCHGDLHPGSVMVNNDGDVKVIDPEFTVYGPPGLDVGSVLSGYVLAAVHQAYSKNQRAVESICEGMDILWKAYREAMIAGGISLEDLQKVESDSVGFTLAEVCRTALEFAGDRKWLQFDDSEVKVKSKKAALTIVRNCMTKRHEEGIQLLLAETRKISIVGTI